MAKTKKKLKLELKYVIFSIALVFAIINGSIILYNINVTNNRNQTIAVSDKPAADKIHAMAVEALNTNKTQAKALFQTARRQYEYILENTTDTSIHDKAQAGIIDCNAQIWMLEHI
jgi:hypothetical protein